MHNVFTPKALKIIAQGRERSERTLGITPQPPFHPERVEQRFRPFVRPFQGRFNVAFATQGALAALATLGFVVQPLRSKNLAHRYCPGHTWNYCHWELVILW